MDAASPERASLGAESSGTTSSMKMRTTSSLGLSPSPTTGLQHRRVQMQALAAAALLQKEFPTARKALIERVVSETRCDLDAARVELETCCFPGDTLVVHGEGWTGEKVEFVEYDGRSVKISYKSQGYTVDQTQCRVFARADGTILYDESEQQYDERQPGEEDPFQELDSEPKEEDDIPGPLPRKKFSLWIDPNQGEGTFRYRPEHYEEKGAGGFVGLKATQRGRLAGAKLRLRSL